jgi:hypothetical protein
MDIEILRIASMNATAVACYACGENQKAAAILIDGLRTIPAVVSLHRAGISASISSTTSTSSLQFQIPQQHQQYNVQQQQQQQQQQQHPQPTFYCPTPMIEHLRSEKCFGQCGNDTYSVHPYNENKKLPCSMQQIDSMKNSMYDEIYSGAFLLGNDIPIAVAEMLAVMSFNLALIIHREGIRTGKAMALCKALQMYQQAYEFLGHTENELRYHPSSIVLVLTAAICTNMSQIQNDLFLSGPVDHMIVCERLSELLVFMEYDPKVHSDDLEFFQATTIFLNLTGLTPAPAA